MIRKMQTETLRYYLYPSVGRDGKIWQQQLPARMGNGLAQCAGKGGAGPRWRASAHPWVKGELCTNLWHTPQSYAETFSTNGPLPNRKTENDLQDYFLETPKDGTQLAEFRCTGMKLTDTHHGWQGTAGLKTPGTLREEGLEGSSQPHWGKQSKVKQTMCISTGVGIDILQNAVGPSPGKAQAVPCINMIHHLRNNRVESLSYRILQRGLLPLV